MKINKIILENIRSYPHQEIEFPEGTILLSGNIGSGKSTILLAIDFVLFGIQGKELSGQSLLRNGEKKGSVHLFLEIDNKNIEIKRVLHRSQDSVKQEAGFIIRDGEKKDLTTTEIKQAVLELLQYPKELLTKSKSLIYKYTVYTPQEEMKQILLGNKESRIDTLRKVFGIDKYKRVQENVKIFLLSSRLKMKEIQTRSEGLQEKQEELKEKQNSKQELITIKQKKDLEKEENKKQLNSKKLIIEQKESEIKLNIEVKRQLDITKVELANKISRLEQLKSEETNLEEEINKLTQEVPQPQETQNFKSQIEELKTQSQTLDTNLQEIRRNIQLHKISITNSENTIKSLTELDTCPTCKQKVSQEYKQNVVDEENKKIQENKLKEREFTLKEQELTTNINNLKEKLQNLETQEKSIELQKVKSDLLNEKKNNREKLQTEQLTIKEEVTKLTTQQNELTSKTQNIESIESSYNQEKQEYESLQEIERNTSIEIAKLDSDIKNINNSILTTQEEIAKKQAYQQQYNKIQETHSFLQERLIELLGTIEKKIMLKIYHDFNSLFQQWFSMLIDQENLMVTLDEEFTPILEQNGYNLDYNFLSGGEKTATALAYRLALNQVINNLIRTIKTRDILILDEPTDGFSNDQLERMRLLLKELKVKQIILVSHEAKIESFVDNVIQIEKNNHVSKII